MFDSPSEIAEIGDEVVTLIEEKAGLIVWVVGVEEVKVIVESTVEVIDVAGVLVGIGKGGC